MSELSTEVQAVEKKFSVILTSHHIILYLGLAAALFAGVYMFESKRAAVAEGKAAVATEVAKQAALDAKTSEQQNILFQQQTALQVQQLTAANAQLQSANATLAQTARTEANALAVQKKADATMTPTQQSQRWETLVPTAIVTSTPTGFIIDPVGGLATIQTLEQAQSLQRSLALSNATVDNDIKTIANDAAILAKEQAAHAADLANDSKQLIASQDETKKVQANFTAYKHTARKKMMIIGVLGFIGGLTAHAFGI